MAQLPSVNPSPSPGPPSPPGIWRVGTLTYTAGGLVTLFFLLLLGDFAWSMRDRSVGQMAQWYLAELKVPSLLFAILISSLPALIALVLGPIISVRSDRHRGKWGRRIPYLLITTPIAVLGMFGLSVSPLLAKWAHAALAPSQPLGAGLHRLLGHGPGATWFLRQTQDELVLSVLLLGLSWLLFEFATIAGQSVFGGLINDVVPPQFLGRFYGLFRAVSLIDGMIFNQWIFGHASNHYTLILIVIALFYGLCFMGVCFAVKEGQYPPPPARPSDLAGEKLFALFLRETRQYLRECFSHPYYLAVFFLLMIANLTFIPVNTFSMQFSRSLHVNSQDYGHYFFLTYATSLVIAFPLGWLVDKFHPLRVAMVTLFVYLLVTLWGGFFATNASHFLTALYLHGVISGCYFTAAASLGNRLFPRSRFAQFSSAVVILGSLAGIVIAPSLGFFIDLTGGVFRYTYLGGSFLAAVALVLAWRVYLRFLQFGGPKNYVAPE